MKLQSKYPSVDCENLKYQYDSELKEFAILEYYNYYEAKDRGEETSFFGALQCFCEQQFSEAGSFSGQIDAADKEYSDMSTADKAPAKICLNVLTDSFNMPLYN